MLPHRARRPQCKQEHIHTHTQTHLSKCGWVEREWGGWGGQRDRGPRGLSLEECCLYLETHISYTSKNKWMPPTLSPPTTSSILLAHSIFPSALIYPPFLPALSLLLSSVSLCIPLPHRSSLFRLSWHPNTHCHPNLILPFCCPPLPTCHAHLCLLYVL